MGPELSRRALLSGLILLGAPSAWAELRPEAVEGWEKYVRASEARIDAELSDGRRFLAIDFFSEQESRSARSTLQKGQAYIRRMKTKSEDDREIPVKDAMIHHWLGAILVPGIKLDALLQWVQDYDQHFKYFKEVERSKLLSRQDSEFKIFLRLRRTKIITVYYNTYHTALYRRHSATRESSRSVATRIAELDDAGSPDEREKGAGEDRGFLWRLNSYWRFEEQDGGVVVECESISLSRGIPMGLAWMIKGYVESVPRESLENTLTAVRDGSRKR
jgi:hypothetical protein